MVPIEHFLSYIKEASDFPEIVEIAVSTRPDCIREDYLEALRMVRKKTNKEI